MKRIVHLGLGNFHRAHQAWYTAQCEDWKITGVVMSNRDLYDQLAHNNNDYLLGTWTKDGLRSEVISVYDDVLLAVDAPDAVTDKISDVDTHVVTLTITEKGYCLRSTDGHLDLTAPGIEADLNAAHPKTAIGLLAEGLIQRAAKGAFPLTVISCDNLSDNGRKLQQAVQDYLGEKNAKVLGWLDDHVTFPNTMVDRITPRLSDDAMSEIASVSTDADFSIVGTEAFSEWIVEDRFASDRPAWDQAGALFVDDVRSFEERKLRLLNSAHSYLAYAGLLAGHRYVHEAIADPKLRPGVNALWDEASVTISKPASDTIAPYRSALLDRFSIIEMRHELSQIAMDGSLKLKERLVPIYDERAGRGLTSPAVEAAIGAWVEYVRHAYAEGFTLSDPNSDSLLRLCRTPTTAVSEIQKLIGFSARQVT